MAALHRPLIKTGSNKISISIIAYPGIVRTVFSRSEDGLLTAQSLLLVYPNSNKKQAQVNDLSTCNKTDWTDSSCLVFLLRER